jgi:hypothetical protein
MSYKQTKDKWDRMQEIHCKHFNTPKPSEGDYEQSILKLKQVYQELVEAGEAEGVSVPIMLWG